MPYREKGKNALNAVLKQKQNINIIEKHLYNISVEEANDEENIENIYKNNLYQTIGDILNGKKLHRLQLMLVNHQFLAYKYFSTSFFPLYSYWYFIFIKIIFGFLYCKSTIMKNRCSQYSTCTTFSNPLH